MLTRLMILMLVLLAPLQAASAETAFRDRRGVVIPTPVRYEFVYEIAKRACPSSYQFATKDVEPFFMSVRNRFVLAPDEVTLLLNYCLIYSQAKSGE